MSSKKLSSKALLAAVVSHVLEASTGGQRIAIHENDRLRITSVSLAFIRPIRVIRGLRLCILHLIAYGDKPAMFGGMVFAESTALDPDQDCFSKS